MRRWAVIQWMLVGITGWVMISQTALAQPSQGEGPYRPPPSPEQRVQRLDRRLNLSDEQKAQLRAAFEDEERQLQAVRDDKSLSPKERRSKLRHLHSQTQSKIRQSLNADQQKKYDEAQDQARERHRDRMGSRRYRR